MLLIFAPLGSVVDDHHEHGLLSRDCYPRVMRARNSGGAGVADRGRAETTVTLRDLSYGSGNLKLQIGI